MVNRQANLSLVRIQDGRTCLALGHAHICEGSVVRHTLLGLSPRHAHRRADRWLAVHRQELASHPC